MKLQCNQLKLKPLRKEKSKKEKRKKLEKKKSITPQMIQNVHQQLFQRSYDLDYLQWMQRNVKHYTIGIALLTLLLSVSIFSTQHQEKLHLYQNVANQPAFQETTQPVEQATDETAHDQHSAAKESESDATLTQINTAEQSQHIVESEQEEQLDDTALSEEPLAAEKAKRVEYQNPMEFSDYLPPTNGQLEQEYGLYYNAIYKDYRFHTTLCYTAGDGCVVSCSSGTVTQIQLADTWQVALQTHEGTIWYNGLDSCTVSLGTQLIAGTQLGTATGIVSIQARI